MQEPQLYHKYLDDFKEISGSYIKKYLQKFQWRNDGSDILMDIGTGPGDTFMNFIHPEIPQNFKKAICVDVLKEMLEFSQNYYKNPEKCEYRQFDITKEELPLDLKGKIHHLTAIHVMHWIEDFGKGSVLSKMYELLSPEGGDCLFIFMPVNVGFDLYDVIIQSDKWSQYLQNIQEYIPKCNYSKDVANQFRCMLEDSGFSEITIEESEHYFKFKDYQKLKDAFKSVCAFLKYIPECRQSEFLDDCIDVIKDLSAGLKDCKYSIKYNLLVAHAKRLPK